MLNKPRLWIAALALSAAGLVGIVGNEGYTDRAVQPVKNDKWTYGLGSTTRPDGKPVQPGDTITPPLAIKLAVRDIAVKEVALRACFGEEVKLTQGEYDAYVDLAYNVGTGAVCRSSIPQKVRRGEYAAACRTILDFKKVQGRDCSLPQNKKFCGGVWTRRLRNFKQCMGNIEE